MKKLLPLLIIPVILVLLILIIIDNKEEKATKIITVNTNHLYLYEQNQTIDISFYTNNNQLPLNNIELYDNFVIKNSDESKVISLTLEEVYYSHSESYLKENYLNYIFKLKMPNLENSLLIDEAYLSFTLSNNESFTIKIGRLSLMYFNNIEPINWQQIDSKKANTEDHSISQIILNVSNNFSNNINITVGLDENLNYLMENDLLIIYLNNLDYYTNNIPIIIFDNNKTYYLKNNYYIKEFALLNKAQEILNIYEFN